MAILSISKIKDILGISAAMSMNIGSKLENISLNLHKTAAQGYISTVSRTRKELPRSRWTLKTLVKQLLLCPHQHHHLHVNVELKELPGLLVEQKQE